MLISCWYFHSCSGEPSLNWGLATAAAHYAYGRGAVYFSGRVPHPAVFKVRFLHLRIGKPHPFNTFRDHSNYPLN